MGDARLKPREIRSPKSEIRSKSQQENPNDRKEAGAIAEFGFGI
jgi:hypothetical protein